MKKIISYVCFVAIALITGVIIVSASGGTASDPIISKSYFEQRLGEERDWAQGLLDPSLAPKWQRFAILYQDSLPIGKTIIFDEGTEFIIRTGTTNTITALNCSGGISNVTTGVDLPHGATAPANRLLVVPKKDGNGRGIVIKTSTIIMVKGGYEIR